MDQNYRESLEKAIRDLHGCEATWARTTLVVEAFRGQPAWSGAVECFGLRGHPTAKECFAWGYPVPGTDRVEYVAVLREPPIESPIDAVRAYIASKAPPRK